MSDTIKHNGKIYQKGRLYFFHDGRREVGEMGFLYKCESGNFFETTGTLWKHCLPAASATDLFGTIEDAPFEPEVGKLYEFSDPATPWSTRRFKRRSGEGYLCENGVHWIYCRPVPAERRAEYGS